MIDRNRNAFGALITDPDKLPPVDKVGAVSKLAAGLLAGNPDKRTCQWLGQKLLDWVHRGGRLEQHLGLAAPPGSHATIHNISLRLRRNDALLRFANTVGNDRAALRILQGKENCPSHALDALGALREYGRVPSAHDAISRARRFARRS